MSKPLRIALALLTACPWLTACTGTGAGTQGSGVASGEAREVPAFDRLTADGSFAVEVEVGPARSVRVQADDNIVPLITPEVEGSVLHVSSRGSFHTSGPIKVTVTTPSLVGVDHSGSGSVRVQGITADSFTAALRGSGAIDLAGTADALEASIEGSGALQAADLVTTRATVDLSGSGGAEVHAREHLTARVSGSGSVRYTGGAQDVVREVHGSGSVAPM